MEVRQQDALKYSKKAAANGVLLLALKEKFYQNSLKKIKQEFP